VRLEDLSITSYIVQEDKDGVRILIERRSAVGAERERWAVTNGWGDVLNHRFRWEREPMPSNRDEEFLERARFDSPELALNAFLKSAEGAAS
jgi:hypothetical protein